MQAVITVNVSPAPTAANPLTIVFDLTASLLADAGVDYTNVQVQGRRAGGYLYDINTC